ncbi:ATP-binding protein [Thermoflexus sp.]|uniref:ATP-binding protein n=1 Tax=Thermoflexus sp. TaxID=1969742 RepID=UPI00175F26E6|nr:ATP-binding protein [Thermoflexus sp.]
MASERAATRGTWSAPPAMEARRLGRVIGGSLAEGLVVKLDPRIAIEGLAVGRYVVIYGYRRRFFGMITDIRLDSVNPDLARMPPDPEDPLIREMVAGIGVFGQIHVQPMLVLEENDPLPRPVKTVPAHFSPVYEATEEEVHAIFRPRVKGREERYFVIGEPLDMPGVRIPLNLDRFVERSSGVFGKSGTGKTFLTRLLLAGVIYHNTSVALIFDMHNEYGWSAPGEGGHVPGLKQLPGCFSRVAIATLDEESSRRRSSRYDLVVRIGYDQIEPEDVELLRGVIGLSEVQIGALYMLRRRLGRDWLRILLEEDREFAGENENEEETETDPLADLVERDLITSSTLGALQRKLGLFHRFRFLVPQASEDAAQAILSRVLEGQSVVLEFGRYGNDMAAYVLVANYLTRRIHAEYVRRKEAALGDSSREPPHLVIVVEEAHKFLQPGIAEHTVFGTIARELRKYNVTLLIVDQRPSQIDSEVLSQIGTRVLCLLDHEEDVRAALSGISGASRLREVLARLETKQQALLLGHAVPMPVVVRTRDYDASFLEELARGEKEEFADLAEKYLRLTRDDD